MKTKLAVIIMVLIFASSYAADTLYSGAEDKTDRLSNDQAGIFSPGYINASMQKTREIINQANKYKSPIEDTAERVKDKLSDDVTTDSANAVTPELKKKTGASGESQINASAVKTTPIIQADETTETVPNYNVSIGSGTDKRDASGKLVSVSGKMMVSEVIDGVKHIYVGFSNAGTSSITSAISLSKAGDIVVVRGKTYSGSITLKDGVKLYGGYNDSGVRDLQNTPTVITNGNITANNIKQYTEINGFVFYGKSIKIGSLTVYYTMSLNNSSNVSIVNNVFAAASATALVYGINMNGIKDSVIKNNTFNTSYCLDIYRTAQNLTVENNTFNSNNSYGNSAMNVYGSSSLLIKDNIFGGTRSISVYNSDTSVSFADNTFETGQRLYTYGYNAKISYKDSSAASQSLQNAISSSILSSLISSNWLEKNKQYSIGGISVSAESVVSIFKNLLANKNSLSQGTDSPINSIMLAKTAAGNSLGSSALSAPVGDISTQKMQIASALASIMKNPTEDQKMMLDSVIALLSVVDEQGKDAASPELKKASDDLLQMVASVLIAQAIPDLLKEGDISNIKNIFASLNTEKMRIMLEYQESTKPYYDQVVKELSKNMSLLQLKDILSGGMTKEELAKIPPNELAKIMEKLSQAKDKSFEEEYMLQQEAKYRKEYIDPNKKILDEKMKAMMKDFTQRLSKVLESTKK